MKDLPPIPIDQLALAFLPVLLVVIVMRRWSLGIASPLYATARMLGQLLLVGYVLTAIFQTTQPLVILLVLTFMLAAASWIALRPVKHRRLELYSKAFAAIAVGGGFILMLMIYSVLSLNPWVNPRYVIPLGGMSFSVAMNCVSLAAERFESATRGGATYDQARQQAMQASLITTTNTLLAVGLVSLPGMMTGQILAGTSPLVAARYQIMIMCMTFSSGGLAASLFLTLLRPSPAEEPNPAEETDPTR